MANRPTIAIVGAGRLASSLVPALRKAGHPISEVISRQSPRSRRAARVLARSVDSRAVTTASAALDADVLWFCVPDREIRAATESFAGRDLGRIKFSFHSSGALTSRELESLRKRGVAVASVHPLMTFVPKGHPSLDGVPFAIEGDPAATRVARRMVRDLGGDGFLLPAHRKAAYHAWATMTSPLLLAFLVTLEEAASAAGLAREGARCKSLPIVRQTLENYSRLGPDDSFSGPIIRGDVETVARHLRVLKKYPAVREVYVALAKSALGKLPAKNSKELRRLL